MKHHNYTNKHPGNLHTIFTKCSDNRLSILIAAFYSLIIHYHSLIANNRLLITTWCIFAVNNAKNHPNYEPISPFAYRPISHIRAIIRAIGDASHRSRITSHWLLFAQAFSKSLIGTKRKTTPKLHHFYTEFDLEWVRNAFGTARTNLEQCNSP